MSLTKIDIIDSIYEKLGIPKKECISIVESVFAIIKDDLYHGNDVMISGGAKEKVDRLAREQSLSRAQRLDLLSEENVRLQIKHLKNLSLIKNMHRKGRLPRIHGWIYVMESGRLKVLVDGREEQDVVSPG